MAKTDGQCLAASLVCEPACGSQGALSPVHSAVPCVLDWRALPSFALSRIVLVVRLLCLSSWYPMAPPSQLSARATIPFPGQPSLRRRCAQQTSVSVRLVARAFASSAAPASLTALLSRLSCIKQRIRTLRVHRSLIMQFARPYRHAAPTPSGLGSS